MEGPHQIGDAEVAGLRQRVGLAVPHHFRQESGGHGFQVIPVDGLTGDRQAGRTG